MELPAAWRDILEREFPYYGRFDADQRAKFEADVAAFVRSKDFVGVEGFVIDDDVRVVVAATAALLALGLDISMFDHVVRIEMRAARYEDEHGHPAEGHYEYGNHASGEPIGVLHLAWHGVLDGMARSDGWHVAIHELAHALDHGLGGELLAQHDRCEVWRRALRGFPLHGTHVVADVEGIELFAVASELFFERPMTLMRIDPALFRAMHDIYKVDPRRLSLRP